MGRLFLSALCAFAAFACGDDDGAMPDAPSADSATPSGDIFIVANRVLTPSSRTVFVHALSSMAAQELDAANAVEVNGRSRVRVFEDAVYIFDGESGRVIRYGVTSERAFVEEDEFSMAELGITRFRSSFAFLSAERAYYIDIPSEQVVVWNPSAMEIVSTFDLVGVVRDEGGAAGGSVHVLGDEVFMPIAWASTTTGEFFNEVAVLVLSASEDRTARIVTDARCAISGGAFVENEQLYVLGDLGSGVYDFFTETAVQSPCLVRIGEGDTAFAADFALDMRAATGAPQVSNAVGNGRGSFVTRVFDTDFDVTTLTNPATYFALELWRYGVVSLPSGETEVIDLPLSGISFDPLIIDGDYYIQQVDEDEGRTTLFRLDGSIATPSVSAAGDIQFAGRLR
ncbi:MAG: hypothetical protein AAF938_24325 [Myxococcota bacterium]